MTIDAGSFREDECVCDAGSYKNGSGSCIQCPGGQITVTLGAISEDFCYCPTGKYKDLDGTCKSCSEGIICIGDDPECQWTALPGKSLAGYTFAENQCYNEKEAKHLCVHTPECEGITKDPSECTEGKFTLRSSAAPAENANVESIKLDRSSCQEVLSAEGFFTGTRGQIRDTAFDGVSSKYSTFKCWQDERMCPRGNIGTCAKGRDPEGLCSECQDGMIADKDSGTCVDCEGDDKLPFVALMLVMFLCVCLQGPPY
jgi:hypothetical protein